MSVSASSNLVQGKAAAAAPVVSNDTQDVELKSIQGDERSVPLEEDIMQLARLGEIGPIKNLFDSGKFDIQYKDDEGITPLHWAAINNQYALCKFLIDAGSDINAKGGESAATPIMWATQRGHYYIANLLLQHGADTLATDVQGYNVLHLATFDGKVLMLVLLLHQNIPVDSRGPHEHTALMWAAYKGYPACVDLYLRWGADVHATDESGFTALHWALVKGSQACIQKLIEYGSDRFAETSNGKTPAITAEEMNSVHAWHRALTSCGYDEEGNPAAARLPATLRTKGAMLKFFFLWPIVIVWCVLMVSSQMVIYAGIPLALVASYCLQYVAVLAIKWAPPDMSHIHRTVSFVPKLGGLTQQKAVIEELLGLWKFDDQNFCVPCMVRRPLRSKHCKRCGRCVAKHDHHCPWVHNCIGINNHRHFFFYLISLEIGVILFVRLTLAYLNALPTPESTSCNILAESVCNVVLRDSYTVALMIWTALQLTWVTMLLIVQLVQIARAQTTFENMQAHMHPEDFHNPSSAITTALVAGTASVEGAQLQPGGAGPGPGAEAAAAATSSHARHRHPHRHPHQGWFSSWKKLLGLDTFVATARGGLDPSSSRRKQNPFSRGMLTNCKDFWCDPAPVFGSRETGAAMLDGTIVNYARMYESPPRMRLRDRRDAYQSVAGDDNAV
ncbi:MAG: hypothetical protein M1825_002075 [Sarcosagium campestre]|nr:MAG: hypothetical protein M1825_002075 [Sarcosagium campestre]